ncbi:flagellar motor switch protein FliG [Rhodobacter sp. Har01]|uniref:flagellar motor switch protein FliG n=1 Tax=Rhodobacter sp. Har01 TaxID=2883999 RepID=UPI001D06B9FC|nr:FliG C-terminal domain-containing protein [Rhodobacter sp. Har01]MCB6177438.1 flagellar motor switch protein FliG [Rhodobacter sp. Har01]
MASERLPLARITPVQRMMTVPGEGLRKILSPREKAAVIVRYLLGEGASLPLAQLPDHMQAALAETMGLMRLVDRQTLDQVVHEFVTELDQVGLAFPGGLEGALSVMDGHISQTAASRLRRKAGVSAKGDPWERLLTLPIEKLIPIIEDEAVEVAAVILSKLHVQRAADILGKLPGEKARRIAYAVSLTGNVDPETVHRIGLAVLGQMDSQPPRAFDQDPVERVGAILNISPAATRDDVLKGLDDADAKFAEQVRKAIFTYSHIPTKITPRDIPKIIRIVDQTMLVTAMAYSTGKEGLEAATEFVLANISQRMAQSIREEMTSRGKIKEKDAEEAMNVIISAIRTLEASGELVMVQPEED